MPASNEVKDSVVYQFHFVFATDTRNVNSCLVFFRASVPNSWVLIGIIFRLRHHQGFYKKEYCSHKGY